jgi:arylsulfatase B
MSGSEGAQCRNGKVDLWKDLGPASELNNTAYEEVLFEDHLHAALETFAAASGPKAQGKPLFLHYAPHLVHSPYQVPDEWLAKFDFIKQKGDDIQGLRQVYAAMNHYMDAVVGNLTEHMKSLGLWENTLMIGCSDNGGPIQGAQGANNHPLRSGSA